MIVEKHIRILCGPQWATGAASAPASRWHMRVGPDDSQRQRRRLTRVDQLELPPPNDAVEERSDNVDGLHRTLIARRGHLLTIDLRLSASVARQAQTTVSAICGQRLAAPWLGGSSVGARVREGRARGSTFRHVFVPPIFTQLAKGMLGRGAGGWQAVRRADVSMASIGNPARIARGPLPWDPTVGPVRHEGNQPRGPSCLPHALAFAYHLHLLPAMRYELIQPQMVLPVRSQISG